MRMEIVGGTSVPSIRPEWIFLAGWITQADVPSTSAARNHVGRAIPFPDPGFRGHR